MTPTIEKGVENESELIKTMLTKDILQQENIMNVTLAMFVT